MYKRILVPMEDEGQQQPALDHAHRLARSAGAAVILAWLVPVAASQEHFFTQIQVEPGSSGARRKEQGEAFLESAARAFRD
ncbi:MAG: universal stress protein, partial [Anaerolineae bacterium]